MDDTVKLASLIFSVSQSTWNTHTHTVSQNDVQLHGGCGQGWSDAHLSLSVAEDDGLCDGQGVVQVTQGVKLPLLSLHGDEELLDPLQSQLITEEMRHQLGKTQSGS